MMRHTCVSCDAGNDDNRRIVVEQLFSRVQYVKGSIQVDVDDMFPLGRRQFVKGR